MIKVMFVCHGNICRSPMGEYLLKELARRRGVSERLFIDSSAVTTEEIGNDVYPPVKRELAVRGIPCPPRAARLITAREVEEYDHILCMDRSNISLLSRISPLAKEKAVLLGKYGLNGAEIEDPWYTGRYGKVYDEIALCAAGFLYAILG